VHPHTVYYVNTNFHFWMRLIANNCLTALNIIQLKVM